MSKEQYTSEEFKIAGNWLEENKAEVSICFPDLFIDGMRSVKNLTLPVVMPRLTAKENYTENEISIITKDKEYECLLKKGDLYCIVDNTGDIEIMHESFFNGA